MGWIHHFDTVALLSYVGNCASLLHVVYLVATAVRSILTLIYLLMRVRANSLPNCPKTAWTLHLLGCDSLGWRSLIDELRCLIELIVQDELTYCPFILVL